MKKLFSLAIVTMLGLIASAQETLIAKGKIEFERRINLHKQLEADEGEDATWAQMMKKSTPQHKVDYFDLYFNDTKALYKPGKEAPPQKISEWLIGPASDNIVYTDLTEQKKISQKAVFENTFLITDSMKNYNWKITSDSRTIAGFLCRKATTIIMDSVFIVAFYTDQIIPAAGPESFGGLPGMILGIAIPRMNITYFATKLQLVELKETDLVIPKKGKKISFTDLREQLQKSLKDWGSYGQRHTWRITI